MKRFQVALLVISISVAVVGLSTAARPLSPSEVRQIRTAWQSPAEVPGRVTRGPEPARKPIALADTASVVMDGNMITSMVSILTALVLIFSLLQRYLIVPVVKKELKEGMAEGLSKLATKEQLDSHIKADELFQKNLLDDMAMKRLEYAKEHAHHYAHEANTGIHQESMSSELIKEKFSGVTQKVDFIADRVDRMAEVIEKRVS